MRYHLQSIFMEKAEAKKKAVCCYHTLCILKHLENSQYHGITQPFRLQSPPRSLSPTGTKHCQGTAKPITVPQCHIATFLNIFREGDSIPHLGSLFQCVKILSVKEFPLISNLNLPCCNMRPFPLVVSLVNHK